MRHSWFCEFYGALHDFSTTQCFFSPKSKLLWQFWGVGLSWRLNFKCTGLSLCKDRRLEPFVNLVRSNCSGTHVVLRINHSHQRFLPAILRPFFLSQLKLNFAESTDEAHFILVAMGLSVVRHTVQFGEQWQFESSLSLHSRLNSDSKNQCKSHLI